MTIPNLNSLPSPRFGKHGWPWTEETPQLPDTMPDGSPWPRISIVTPSLNQGQFIEETIRSVLLQGYPNLEYIIIDAGSTDGSMHVIKKYAPWLAYWVSEPDRGQSHAINKGMKKATGSLVAWINSDDVYRNGVFHEAAQIFSQIPDLDLVYGMAEIVDERSKPVGQSTGEPFDLEKLISVGNLIPQPSTFFTAKAFHEVGGLSEEYDFAMDFELWLKIGLSHQVRSVDSVWAQFRLHSASKTGSEKIQFQREDYEIIRQILHRNHRLMMDRAKILAGYALKVAQSHQKFGKAIKARQWAFKALAHNPSLVWRPIRERGIFYSIVMGKNLLKALRNIRGKLS